MISWLKSEARNKKIIEELKERLVGVKVRADLKLESQNKG